MYYEPTPKSCGKKELRRYLATLKEIANTATMENASFDSIGGDNSKTAEIRELTQLWRQTWIISPLDRVIARIEAILDEK